MGREAFESIKAGLEDAVAYAKGRTAGQKKHRVKISDVDVRALRKKLKLSQDRFAETFGVSASTIRNWEQGRRRPEGPARVLLHIISREPKAVMKALFDR